MLLSIPIQSHYYERKRIMRLFEAKDLTKKYDKTVLNHLDLALMKVKLLVLLVLVDVEKVPLQDLFQVLKNLLQVLYYIKEKQLILKRVVKIYNLFFKIQLKAFRHE